MIQEKLLYNKEIINLFKNIIKGDIFFISKGISLIENMSFNNCKLKLQLLEHIVYYNQSHNMKSLKIAFSGVPGAGKSTVINALTYHINSIKNEKTAILLIDPINPIKHGSLMGDKLRMTSILKKKNVFIRAFNNRDSYLSLNTSIYDVCLLLTAAGYSNIFIETIGSGQAEYDIFYIVDLLCLVLQPIEGDSIQSIKKGILNLADYIIINKHDEKKKSYFNITSKYYTSNNVVKINYKTMYGIKVLYEKIFLNKKYTTLNQKKNIFNFWLYRIISNSLGSRLLKKKNNIIIFENINELLLKKKISLAKAIDILIK